MDGPGGAPGAPAGERRRILRARRRRREARHRPGSRGAFDRALPVDEIVGIIRGEVAESHDLNVFALLLLRRGSLPKTASGKLQRQACRRFFTHGGPQVLAWWVAPTGDQTALPRWLVRGE